MVVHAPFLRRVAHKSSISLTCKVPAAATRAGADARAPPGLAPSSVDKLQSGDVKGITLRALDEAHGEKWWNLLDWGYPVPRYMQFDDCAKVVRACMPNARL